jgi:GTPase SAR1 family protein
MKKDDELSLSGIYRKWHNDLLELNEVNKTEDESVICIVDGEYGSGKTTLVKQWYEELNNTNIENDDDDHIHTPAAFFSAWEHDDSETPLLDVTAALITSIKKEGDLAALFDPAKLKNILAKALPVATALLLPENVKTAIDKIVDNMMNRKASPCEELREFLKEITEKSSEPFFIFIDELDRAKPHYVLSLLEQLKHVFNIPNVIFVLVMNKAQLAQTIEHCYGYKEGDGKAYLERFFHKHYIVKKDQVRKHLICDAIIKMYQKEKGCKNQPKITLHDVNHTFNKIIIKSNTSYVIHKGREAAFRREFRGLPNLYFPSLLNQICLNFNFNLRELDKMLKVLITSSQIFFCYSWLGHDNPDFQAIHYDINNFNIMIFSDFMLALFLAVKQKYPESLNKIQQINQYNFLRDFFSDIDIWNELTQYSTNKEALFNLMSYAINVEPFKCFEEAEEAGLSQGYDKQKKHEKMTNNDKMLTFHHCKVCEYNLALDENIINLVKE